MDGFNGAPRLGLGEGVRRAWLPEVSQAASMGLRDWVSEKVERKERNEKLINLLQWGSETGSRRRRAVAHGADCSGGIASMGLRDWVSEKGGKHCTITPGEC